MLGIILRILLGAAISGGIHYYVWRRLVRPLELPPKWQRTIGIAMLVLFVVNPLTTWLRNVWPGFSSTMGWVAYPWMALAGLLFVATAVLDLVRFGGFLGSKLAARTAPSEAPPNLSRRTFLARVGGGAAITMASSATAKGLINTRGTHEIVDVEITLAKLPKALDGFSIVQLSDLHVGLTIDREFVQHVVDQTNALSPDLIALTGDLVDGQVEDLRDDFAPLGALRAQHGVFAVTGNHEYYSGADPWIAELRRLGVRVLRNERVTIGEAASFELAGVDDHGAKGAGHGEDLAAATSGRDPQKALVLLAHQPRQVRRAHKFGVDLQLSGHTHGGQIWPWHYIVKIQQGGLLAGRYTFGNTQLYVTRGCGYWGPPVRVLAPLEITRVILRAA